MRNQDVLGNRLFSLPEPRCGLPTADLSSITAPASFRTVCLIFGRFSLQIRSIASEAEHMHQEAFGFDLRRRKLSVIFLQDQR